MSGDQSPIVLSAWLIALKQKGEIATEVAGMVDSMRHHAVRVDLTSDQQAMAVDGCGTGGDGAGTFNISTAASLIAAAAGAVVAKHGNRSVSSKCGSADVLEAMGVRLATDSEEVQQQLASNRFSFLFAPNFHPAMKHAAPVRRELGVRTVFNILGPLSNPALVQRQVVGVYDRSLLWLMIETLKLLGAQHAIVVHGRDGLDEFSLSAPTDLVELKDGKVTEQVMSPEDVGLATVPTGALAGGDATANARIMEEVLVGQPSPYADASCYNAGAMLYVGRQAISIRDGVDLARRAVADGTAIALLNELRNSATQ